MRPSISFGLQPGLGGSLVLAACATPPPPLEIAAPLAPPPARIPAPARSTASLPMPAPMPASRFEPASGLAPDLHFGKAGRVLFSRVPGEHELKGVAVAPDGSILAAGHAEFADGLDACVAKFRPDGSADATFGERGVVRVGRNHTFGERVAIDARGRILFAGYFDAGRRSTDLLLARLEQDGSLDTSFAGSGIATADFGGTDDRPVDLVPLVNGGVLVAGIHSLPKNDYELYVAQFDDSGELEPRFGRGGAAFFDPVPGREFVTRARAASSRTPAREAEPPSSDSRATGDSTPIGENMAWPKDLPGAAISSMHCSFGRTDRSSASGSAASRTRRARSSCRSTPAAHSTRRALSTA